MNWIGDRDGVAQTVYIRGMSVCCKRIEAVDRNEDKPGQMETWEE